MLVTFYGTLSPDVLYIGHRLLNIIPILLIYKYYQFKITVISFKMLYDFTWNLKTNLNTVSNFDFVHPIKR